jgi:hypothetical protein
MGTSPHLLCSRKRKLIMDAPGLIPESATMADLMGLIPVSNQR